METRHSERREIGQRLAAIRAAHTFNGDGICADYGKYEGCYESTVYFADCTMDGDTGVGCIDWPDGSWETAFKVTPMERALMAGPWDGPDNHPLKLSNVLYIVMGDENGGIRGSHMGEAEWVARQAERDASDDD